MFLTTRLSQTLFCTSVIKLFFCTHLLTRPTIVMKAQVHQAAHFHLEMNLKVVRLFYLQPDWAFIELLPWLLWPHLHQISLCFKTDGVHIPACGLGNNPEYIWMPPQGHACSGCHQLHHSLKKFSENIVNGLIILGMLRNACCSGWISAYLILF